ncbi:MAG: PHP domain-containing protein [Ruminococcaceae bacterium]|nr:PHP domain-containing protein [Oscillospiraceae bacterium]
MIQDLHSHTYYSFCGKDKPDTIVEAAIAGGIELFGICDHNYGIGYCHPEFFHSGTVLSKDYGRSIKGYYDHMDSVRKRYADRIKILVGIEISTSSHPCWHLPEGQDVSYFDYCLIESLDAKDSVTGGDLFAYAKRCATPMVGVAHTDMFKFIESRGEDSLEYFSRMAEENIFWEMNVSYDSIHQYRVHKYMLDFFENEEQQDIVRRSGVKVSVGFDGHKVEDYLPERVADYCRRLEKLNIKKPYED